MIRPLIAAGALALTSGTACADNAWDYPELRPLVAATRFLGAQYAPREATEVDDETAGCVGEILEVNPVPGLKCGFRCGFSVKKRGARSGADVLEMTNFSRLTGEVTWRIGTAGYVDATSHGAGKNVTCDAHKRCDDHITMTLLPAEFRTTVNI